MIWRQIWANSPQERPDREVKQRSDAVGIFPNRGAIVRLIESALAEYNDGWIISRRYMSLKDGATQLHRLQDATASLLPPFLDLLSLYAIYVMLRILGPSNQNDPIRVDACIISIHQSFCIMLVRYQYRNYFSIELFRDDCPQR